MSRKLKDRSSVARAAEQRLRLYALVCLAVTAVVGCGGGPTSNDPAGASNYLETALNVMQENSINRFKIDWPTLRARAVERASGATTATGTYPAIRLALEELGDNHSSFVEPTPPSPEKGRNRPDSVLPIWLVTS